MAQSKGHRYKMKVGIPNFYLDFSYIMGPNKECMLFRKSSFSGSVMVFPLMFEHPSVLRKLGCQPMWLCRFLGQ
jgi:hypothetical protein